MRLAVIASILLFSLGTTYGAEAKKPVQEKKTEVKEKQVVKKEKMDNQKQAAEKKQAVQPKNVAEEKQAEQPKNVAEKKQAEQPKKVAEKKQAVQQKKVAEKKQAVQQKKVVEKKQAVQQKKVAEKKQAPAEKAAAKPAKKMATKVGSQSINVARLSIATNIENREPVGASDKFSSDVTSLYCFSHIKGVADTINIQHKWYKEDAALSNVTLSVRSPSWRTYSRVNLPEQPKGSYKVDIVNAETDQIMKTIQFTVN
ncbi:MAG: DUF2914 domain-containing protein [Chitinivibrionales bacterium]